MFKFKYDVESFVSQKIWNLERSSSMHSESKSETGKTLSDPLGSWFFSGSCSDPSG
jgi:hypothetical protein